MRQAIWWAKSSLAHQTRVGRYMVGKAQDIGPFFKPYHYRLANKLDPASSSQVKWICIEVC